jgi:hypothetical protein
MESKIIADVKGGPEGIELLLAVFEPVVFGRRRIVKFQFDNFFLGEALVESAEVIITRCGRKNFEDDIYTIDGEVINIQIESYAGKIECDEHLNFVLERCSYEGPFSRYFSGKYSYDSKEGSLVFSRKSWIK